MKSQWGFTLVELLVVMAIIGILTSIIGGNFITTRLKARDARRKNDITQMQRALESYLNDHGRYPESSGGLVVIDDGTNTLDWGDPFVDLAGTVYMANLPIDPTAISTFYYVAAPNALSYQIYAHLENNLDNSIPTDPLPAYTDDECGSGCNWGVSSANVTIYDSIE